MTSRSIASLPAPAAFLRKVRLDLARQMLVTTDMPLAEIAERRGFGYLSHFSRAFKANHGVAPSRYRQAHRFDAELRT